MKRLKLSTLVYSLLLVCFGMQVSAGTETFGAKLDRSQWYLTSSIFECSIVHEIPVYGKGVFFHEAGEPLRFYTAVTKNVMKPGRAALVIEASSWRPGTQIEDLGYVDVVKTKTPLNVKNRRATAMMHGLLEGKAPTFTRRAWYGDGSIRVVLNSINFASVYDGYQDCVSSLLSVNFRQVERTKVHFTVDKALLTKKDKESLDRVILYTHADSSVSAIYVDGHTDSTGRRIYNRRLSKARAEAVTRYLVAADLNPDMIQTRYHGERYPVADNRSKKSKAQNRRSTVRLVRGETLAMPNEKSPDGELN
mgnify:FL=1